MGRTKFSAMPTASAKRRRGKSKATKLVRDIPAALPGEDVVYRIYVRQKIEAGLSDLRSGRTHSHASIRKEFAVP